MFNRLCTLILIIITFISCSDDYKTVEWYESNKTDIIKYSTQKPDSITTIKNDHVKTISHYLEGQLIYLRRYNLSYNNLGTESSFYPSRNLELKKEINDENIVVFEGICIDGEPFGLSRWWNDNGELIETGYRENGKQIGIWYEYKDNGKTELKIDYDNLE